MTSWAAVCQAPLSSTVSQTWLKFMSTELVMLSNHLFLCRPLLLSPLIFPSIRVFSSEFALCIRWPKYWSFSFSNSLSMNNQGWIPLGLTGMISPCSPSVPQVSFPAPQFESFSSLTLSLLYGPTLTSVYDYWKNCSFDYTDLCR